ncbi:uncharacterized protein LOC131620142 [Vicia villosa]|uniref:uncharacterized protein LOC131620142 n=1 Tax=Vicia villosa TaxID=3911 RepID=UPI00273C2B8C|nr:uncharacterized protein LOC131620142 [Vicia villosa]
MAATGPILGSTGTIQGNNSTFVTATSISSNAQVSPVPQFGTQGTPPPNQGFGDQRQWRDPPYGMPYSYIAGLSSSKLVYPAPNVSAFTPFQNFGSGVKNLGQNGQGQNVIPTLTTNNQAAFRQQMDASNQDMNINKTNQDNSETCQQLSAQMGQIANFLGAPETSVRRWTNQIVTKEDELTINQVRPPRLPLETEILRAEQHIVRLETPEEQPGRVVLVDRNQNADEVIHRVRKNNQMETNLTAMIERIMAQNGLNIGLRRPNYTSPLSDYVLQADLPRGRKVPTKFSGDTSESTTEHIARYMTEVGDLANNEDLRMKYFPSSLTKKAFTWFTTLPPNSIDTWSQFCLLKARCFTVVPEHELVEMAAGGLDYSIRKKLDTQYLRDIAQLDDKVRQVEILKAEKARANKSYKKERVTYVEVDEGGPDTFEDQYGFEDCEVDLAELKEADGQIVLPSNIKIPPFEQRKKRGYCKYHNFLGHKTSQCFLFRDLIQNAIKEGRLKFADKGKSQM